MSCLRFLMFLGFKKKMPSENFGTKTWPPNFQVWGNVLQPVDLHLSNGYNRCIQKFKTNEGNQFVHSMMVLGGGLY